MLGSCICIYVTICICNCTVICICICNCICIVVAEKIRARCRRVRAAQVKWLMQKEHCRRAAALVCASQLHDALIFGLPGGIELILKRLYIVFVFLCICIFCIGICHSESDTHLFTTLLSLNCSLECRCGRQPRHFNNQHFVAQKIFAKILVGVLLFQTTEDNCCTAVWWSWQLPFFKNFTPLKNICTILLPHCHCV